jgi:hypothetical protein
MNAKSVLMILHANGNTVFILIPDVPENEHLFVHKSSTLFDMWCNGDLNEWKIIPGTRVSTEITRCVRYDMANY